MRRTTEPARASADWLALRESADASARSVELVALLQPLLPADGPVEVHDLGSGTGSMARWLAGRLPGRQRWLLYDRDAALLERAAADPPRASADGAAVTVETRLADLTRLDGSTLSGAGLVTASALLDMLTAAELERLVATCAGAGCPVLFTLSVVGHVELVPAEPLDVVVQEAFNSHQQRTLSSGALLGPNASRAATRGFLRAGLDVTVRASPWRLDEASPSLTEAWFRGWLDAAVEQQRELADVAPSYAARRLAQFAAGDLRVTVHHEDLLARAHPSPI